MKTFKDLLAEANAQDFKGKKDTKDEIEGMEPRDEGERDFKKAHTDKKKVMDHPTATDDQHDGGTQPTTKGRKGNMQEARRKKAVKNVYIDKGWDAADEAYAKFLPATLKLVRLANSWKVDRTEVEKIYNIVKDLEGDLEYARQQMERDWQAVSENYQPDDVEQLDEEIPRAFDQLWEKASTQAELAGRALEKLQKAAGRYSEIDKNTPSYIKKLVNKAYDLQAEIDDMWQATDMDFGYMDEAFKAGKMKLKDGSTVNMSADDAAAVNSTIKQMPNNGKKFEAEMTKNAKSFKDMLAFARSGFSGDAET